MVNYLHISDNFAKFVAWIGGSCKPSEKGKLTAFPRFTFCQHNFNNVSSMLRFEELPEINSERWLSLEDLPGEEWRDVVNYKDFLSISCYGRLKRKERLSYNPHNKSYCRYKEKILRLCLNKLGYANVNLSIHSKIVYIHMHREVAFAFLPNPNNLPFINHRDENPSNNTVSNLEWCTPEYNSNYGTVRERRRRKRIEDKYAIPVVLYDYEGNVLKKYETLKDAALDNGVDRESVSLCCKGKSSSAKGLHFRYENERYKKREIKLSKILYEVYRGDELIIKTKNCKEMCRTISVDYGTFRNAILYNRCFYHKLCDFIIMMTNPKGEKFIVENGIKRKV